VTGKAFFASQSYCGVAEDEGKVVGLYILHPNNVGRCGHICNASIFSIVKATLNRIKQQKKRITGYCRLRYL